jgi:hypothetical protein
MIESGRLVKPLSRHRVLVAVGQTGVTVGRLVDLAG